MLAFGLNHKTAPIDVRDKVALGNEQVGGLNASVLLSTCNRTEIYCPIAHSPALLDWFANSRQLPRSLVETLVYIHQDKAAIKHMMRVACGLDSLVLGEPQILGQMKHAYQQAHAAGRLDKQLERAFQATFAVAKLVRSDTGIGASPVSVAYAAVKLAAHIFADLSQTRVLIIGAGQNSELLAQHVIQQGVKQLSFTNRTLSKAVDLAKKFTGSAVPLALLGNQLAQVDIVLASTASTEPLLTEAVVRQAMKARKNKPMLLVDLAVPRDIEASVSGLSQVYLYTVDDLQQIVKDNFELREQAVLQAEHIIENHAESFMAWLNMQRELQILRAFRDQGDQYRDQVLQKAKQLLHNGHDPEQVMAVLAHELTNKLLHQPTVAIRQASADNQQEALAAYKKLVKSYPDESEH